jgi:C-terminal processing protease CtpA/Prc
MTQLKYILLVLISIGFISCDKSKSKEFHKIQEIEKSKDFVFKTMSDIYLYNQEIPEYFDHTQYEDEKELFNSLISKNDHSSFLIESGQIRKWDSDCEYMGIGAKFTIVSNDEIYITNVYKESDLYYQGIVNRGWKLSKVDQKEVKASNLLSLLNSYDNSSRNFKLLLDSSGTQREIDVLKQNIKVNPVIDYKIIDQNQYKIGYLVYDSFHKEGIEELGYIFNEFKNEKIKKLIVDVRYNSSGSFHTAANVGSMISSSLKNKKFFNIKHNSNFSDRDTTIYFNDDKDFDYLNMEEVIFLTGPNTSGISELFINSLKEHLKIITIGEPTAGNTNGLYKVEDNFNLNLTLATIAFTYENQGSNIYPDIPVYDNVVEELGSQTEDLLEKALEYIKTEKIKKQKKIKFSFIDFKFTPFQKYIGKAL